MEEEHFTPPEAEYESQEKRENLIRELAEERWQSDYKNRMEGADCSNFWTRAQFLERDMAVYPILGYPDYAVTILSKEKVLFEKRREEFTKQEFYNGLLNDQKRRGRELQLFQSKSKLPRFTEKIPLTTLQRIIELQRERPAEIDHEIIQQLARYAYCYFSVVCLINALREEGLIEGKYLPFVSGDINNLLFEDIPTWAEPHPTSLLKFLGCRKLIEKKIRLDKDISEKILQYRHHLDSKNKDIAWWQNRLNQIKEILEKLIPIYIKEIVLPRLKI